MENYTSEQSKELFEIEVHNNNISNKHDKIRLLLEIEGTFSELITEGKNFSIGCDNNDNVNYELIESIYTNTLKKINETLLEL